ncbi:esterase B1-like [Aedes albopictus]|uniref:Carboxylic ester hydrolase n=1 Tax=Aedes albopictus TaxID=7160 RepID=A0ABM1YVG1_AEDAL
MVMRRSTTGGDPTATLNRKIVTLRQGMVNGVRDRLPNGSDYYYFKGIPYARPPVGDLRFEPPVPLDKFPATVLDCSQERSNYVGMNLLTRKISGREDGLYLNVYTPALPVRGQVEPKLPVMVFIHGGGLIGGSGDSLLYNPNYMVQEGVVFVTMNYRVGVLGLLCLPEAGIHGNGDLKDQLMALRWVNENISKFGGDPSNVTLFGSSSGGSCVGLHCMSDTSKKYFHKAIMQCGHHMCDFTYGTEMVQKARDLAKLFGYTGSCDKEALQVLKNVSAEQLVQRQFEVFTPRERKLEEAYGIPFAHVIERRGTKDAVLTKNPMELIRTPGSFNMPIIIGTNDAEGSFELKNAIQHLEDYDKEVERLVPRSFNVDFFSPAAKQVGEEIKQLFFDGKPIAETNIQDLSRYISEKNSITSYVLAYFGSFVQKNPNIYQFFFTFDGALNNGKTIAKLPPLKGAGHMDELFYVFTSATLAEVPESDKAYQVRQTMVRLWTNFAKYSDPTPASKSTFPFRWEPVALLNPGEEKSFDMRYLKIDHTPQMSTYDSERLSLWLRLHEKYNGHITNLPYPIDDMNLPEATLK